MLKFFVSLIFVVFSWNCLALDVMPDLDTTINSIPISDPQTQNALRSATKAACIQSGIKKDYDVVRQNVNRDGEQGKDATANFIDNNTFFTHDQVFGAAAVAVMVVKKSATTSFADPLYKPIHHYITVGPSQMITGIRWDF